MSDQNMYRNASCYDVGIIPIEQLTDEQHRSLAYVSAIAPLTEIEEQELIQIGNAEQLAIRKGSEAVSLLVTDKGELTFITTRREQLNLSNAIRIVGASVSLDYVHVGLNIGFNIVQPYFIPLVGFMNQTRRRLEPEQQIAIENMFNYAVLNYAGIKFFATIKHFQIHIIFNSDTSRFEAYIELQEPTHWKLDSKNKDTLDVWKRVADVVTKDNAMISRTMLTNPDADIDWMLLFDTARIQIAHAPVDEKLIQIRRAKLIRELDRKKMLKGATLVHITKAILSEGEKFQQYESNDIKIILPQCLQTAAKEGNIQFSQAEYRELLSLVRTLMYGTDEMTTPKAAQAIPIHPLAESKIPRRNQRLIDPPVAGILVNILNAAWTNMLRNLQNSDETLISLSPIPLIEEVLIFRKEESNLYALDHFRSIEDYHRIIKESPMKGLQAEYTLNRPKLTAQLRTYIDVLNQLYQL